MAREFLPLEGVRVVDVTSSLAGPYCTEILAALGASVVKVEHPERGDEARAWGRPFWEDASVMFYAVNMSKRSLPLDIKRGRDVLLRLVLTADVFLQSLRPGTAERLGFGRRSCARTTLGSSTATSARSAGQGRCVTVPATTRCCRRSAAS
jgi:crotonobetainyl-CoA:carnitine CoA-transferase CaiB-like acyl-CoA transferase